MSYQYFNDSAIAAASAHAGGPLVSLPAHGFTPGEQLAFNAELTRSFLEYGTLHQTDFADAERQAMLHGFQSDVVLDQHQSPYQAGTEAGSHIKQALLAQSYLENGHVSYSDMVHADTQSQLQGPIEQYNFDSTLSRQDLSPGGDFIRNSYLTDSYLDHCHWNYSDVAHADIAAQAQAPLIDHLF